MFPDCSDLDNYIDTHDVLALNLLGKSIDLHGENILSRLGFIDYSNNLQGYKMLNNTFPNPTR